MPSAPALPCTPIFAGGYTEPMDKTVALHLQTLTASDQALSAARPA